MDNYMNKVAKDLSIYFGGNVFAKLLRLATLFIIIRSLSVEEYGIYGIVVSIIAIIQSIILLGNDSSIAFFYFKFKTDRGKGKFLSSVFLTNLLASLIAVLISIGLFFFYEGAEYSYLIPLCSVVNMVILLFSTLIRNEFNSVFSVTASCI